MICSTCVISGIKFMLLNKLFKKSFFSKMEMIGTINPIDNTSKKIIIIIREVSTKILFIPKKLRLNYFLILPVSKTYKILQ